VVRGGSSNPRLCVCASGKCALVALLLFSVIIVVVRAMEVSVGLILAVADAVVVVVVVPPVVAFVRLAGRLTAPARSGVVRPEKRAAGG